jgi:tetratricopeptide (TPR) repeat protein
MNAGPYGTRADAKRMQGDCDGAIADANEAIRLDPESAFNYATRGCAYTEKGDYSRAIADLKECLRLSPSYSWAAEQLRLVFRQVLTFG